MRRVLTCAVAPFALVTLVAVFFLRPGDAAPDLSAVLGVSGDVSRATVVAIESKPCDVVGQDDGFDTEFGAATGGEVDCDVARVRLTSGPDRGEVVELEVGGSAAAAKIHAGSRIVVGTTSDGNDVQYYFADFQRGKPIVVLLVLFALAAVGFGRWSGVRALGALVASLLVIVWFVIPGVLTGHSPVAVALTGSALIMFVVLYLTGGLNMQTTVAVLGTMVSLALIALLATVFVAASRFTGLASEDAVFLHAAVGSIDLEGLLLGGIIIGSLGVLDDMTVTQVSAVWELRRANDEYDMRSLYSAAARIGRDHIASTVNTLVLAYVGAALPLMIFFTSSDQGIGTILTSEVIAIEVVRTIVGSIGLIASVPITTAMAAYVVTRHDVEHAPQ